MISELRGWPSSDKLSGPGQKSDVILHLQKHLLHVRKPFGSRGGSSSVDGLHLGQASQRRRASGSPSGLPAAIAGRFRLGIEVWICVAPGVTSSGGGLALLIARKAAVAARPADVAALEAIGTRRCRHRGRARHRHRQKCPTHRLCPRSILRCEQTSAPAKRQFTFAG